MPMLVSHENIISSVSDVFNAVLVDGDAVDKVMFYGRGAGKFPTASAVVADVVDCCKHLKTRKYLFWADGNGSNIIPYTESKTAGYVRIKGESALDKAEKLFGAISVIKREDVPADEAAFVTTEMPFGDITEKIESLKNEGVEVLSTIRIGDL